MRCAVLEEGVPSTKKMAALSRGSTPPSRLSFPRALVFPPEVLHRRRFQSQAEARMALFQWLEGWYNPHRRHSALGYLSPVNYERRQLAVSA